MEPTKRSLATDGTRLRTLWPGCSCSSECADAGVSWSSPPVAGRAGRGHHWPRMEPTGRLPAMARSRPRTNLPGWPCSWFEVWNCRAGSRGSSQESTLRIAKSLPLLLVLSSCYLWKHHKTGMVIAQRPCRVAAGRRRRNAGRNAVSPSIPARGLGVVVVMTQGLIPSSLSVSGIRVKIPPIHVIGISPPHVRN